MKYNRFTANKILVIAPKKVAEDTWVREVSKWDHLKHLRVITCLGTAKKRIKALCSPADIYVVSRDSIVWLVDYYQNDWPFDTVIIDELTSFKSNKAKRFKALKAIRPRIKRVIGLTGTPSPNGLEDLWAQVYLIDKGERLGKNITWFRDEFMYKAFSPAGEVRGYGAKQGADTKIQSLIGDVCISLKAEDYLTLPDLVEDIRYISLDTKTEKLYKEFARDLLMQIEDEELTASSAAVLTNKLLQFCNGAMYNDDREVIHIHDHKLDVLMEMIEELDGRPALVFYNYQHDRDRIKKALSKTGLVVKDLKTSKEIDEWNRGEINIALAHPASTAYGLNLQDGGNHLIWFGLNWSLELYQQAIKRLHRQGQKQKVFNHILVVEGKSDIDVLRALGDKGDTQNRLIDALKARIKEIKED